MQPGLDVAPAQQRGDLLLDVLGLAFLDDQHRALAGAEIGDLLGHQRVGHVEHSSGMSRVAEGVGQAELLQRAHQRVVQAALHDDAQVRVPCRANSSLSPCSTMYCAPPGCAPRS